MSIKRYVPIVLTCGTTPYASMNEATDGDWVRVEVFDAAVAERDKNRDACEDFHRQLSACVAANAEAQRDFRTLNDVLAQREADLERITTRNRDLTEAIEAACEGGPVLEDYGEHPAVVAAEALYRRWRRALAHRDYARDEVYRHAEEIIALRAELQAIGTDRDLAARNLVRLINAALDMHPEGRGATDNPHDALAAAREHAATLARVHANVLTEYQTMRALLAEWLSTPYFDTAHEWEKWCREFRPRVVAAVYPEEVEE